MKYEMNMEMQTAMEDIDDILLEEEVNLAEIHELQKQKNSKKRKTDFHKEAKKKKTLSYAYYSGKFEVENGSIHSRIRPNYGLRPTAKRWTHTDTLKAIEEYENEMIEEKEMEQDTYDPEMYIFDLDELEEYNYSYSIDCNDFKGTIIIFASVLTTENRYGFYMGHLSSPCKEDVLKALEKAKNLIYKKFAYYDTSDLSVHIHAFKEKVDDCECCFIDNNGDYNY